VNPLKRGHFTTEARRAQREHLSNFHVLCVSVVRCTQRLSVRQHEAALR